jgi:hypothetical protein
MLRILRPPFLLVGYHHPMQPLRRHRSKYLALFLAVEQALFALGLSLADQRKARVRLAPMSKNMWSSKTMSTPLF